VVKCLSDIDVSPSVFRAPSLATDVSASISYA